MEDHVEYVPITTEDAVEAVLSGAWLYRADIPDFRALIEGAKHGLHDRNLGLEEFTLRCVTCRIEVCNCAAVEIPFEVNVGNRTLKTGEELDHAAHDATVFNSNADFSAAVFAGVASFTGVEFRQRCRFRGATFRMSGLFNQVVVQGDADFTSARFEMHCWFKLASFQGNADFALVRFKMEADFSDASFLQGVKFVFASFAEPAHFHGARFEGPTDFGRAVFEHKISFGDATLRALVSFVDAELNSWLEFDGADFESNAQVSFEGIDVRPGGQIKLTIDQIGRGREKLIDGEDSNDKEDLASAAAQYNMLRDNFRTLPSTDEEEDRCHYKYMDLRRRASNWRWPKWFADWFLLKWCWGYGIYVHRTIISILLVILGFGLMYQLFAGPETIRNYYVDPVPTAQGGAASTPDTEPRTEFHPLYFSIITFTTIGYGDYAPLGWLRWVAGAEGLTGLFLMAVFTVSFARKFIR